ncbi:MULTISPECIES: fructose-6-phosphate aldolase [Thermodesulfobacterium]|jgi:transaldolase|uniref:Probable transaldolase n=2 Tax=Thermodesulfobacterium commune TaxID=1741 RepID=A0A075WU45_9BACT|nr:MULTISPECIES: fructose-6-phosphate aldolase [Thermodesulfobacterium]KUJ98319.1 MAG: putative transaldolase [Thermodesulfobacterium sp. 37_54]KUK19910.1 MAG: putative transaldolase [Thermodesulfobacterium commune]AIH03918.1 transaldolase [Thermodesulfobacterium commune DSM 2178]KUK38307.1 MAG: putative transaldolase [Thermodesulfobacterium commune]MBZ4681794.1 transaldolase [Thermodesulfobacterium sp.]
MKIFVDTAKIEEIRKVKEWGILDGVTTNPTLLSQTGKPWKEAALEILNEVPDLPVSLEVLATDFEGMVKEAKELAKMGDNVVIKIPFTVDGIKAVQALAAEQIPTNVTLVFSPMQALIAAKAGATFVSPFVGRIDDISYDGISVLEEIIQIYAAYGFETEVIAASIRHVDHVRKCALLGVDIATIPFKVIEQMFKHPLTDIGLAKFLEDAKKANISIL